MRKKKTAREGISVRGGHLQVEKVYLEGENEGGHRKKSPRMSGKVGGIISLNETYI